MSQSYPSWVEANGKTPDPPPSEGGTKANGETPNTPPSEVSTVEAKNSETCGETLGPLGAWQENMRAEAARILNRGSMDTSGKIGRFFNRITNGKVLDKLQKIILESHNPEELTERILRFAPALLEEDFCELVEAMYQQKVFVDSVAKRVIPELQKTIKKWKEFLSAAAGACCAALLIITPGFGIAMWGLPTGATLGAYTRMRRGKNMRRPVGLAKIENGKEAAFKEWCRGTEEEDKDEDESTNEAEAA